MRPIFDNRDFIEWLARQKQDGTYNYDNCKRCLIARYFHYRGFKDVHVNSSFLMLKDGGPAKELPMYWNYIAQANGHTFGRALERARMWLR